MSTKRENEGNPVYKFYKHYKYYHFYSVCFGLGCSMVSYRPFRSVWFPSVLGVFSTIVFEILGIALDLPAHTKECKGPPYNKRGTVLH
ncbi:hypothetical protein ILYODFUR_023339 [Ilyodon furcidens]|uniref:Uncharacterized protein n=1 Tax=Ilyodon furcidens TaxID=33524 RepID=A0ABV0UIF4_9TELE